MKNVNLTITVAFAALLILGITSCNNNQQASAVPEQTVSQVMEIDELLSDIGQLANQSVAIEGICTHTCKHGAVRMFLMGSDDSKTIRVEAGELGSFDTKCVNNIVKVNGKVVETRIDEEYLQKLEAQAKANYASSHSEEEICEHSLNAAGETANSTLELVNSYREKIAKRQEESGKAYLSQYYILADSYEIE